MRESHHPLTDDAIRAVVARLARPHRTGGSVIERAAILAEGDNSGAILDWIAGHAGEPEAAAPAAPARGLYGSGFGGGVTAPRAPSRYVLPAGALTAVDDAAPDRSTQVANQIRDTIARHDAERERRLDAECP